MHFVAWQVNHERSAYGTSTKRLKMKVYPQYTFFFKLNISLDLLNFLWVYPHLTKTGFELIACLIWVKRTFSQFIHRCWKWNLQCRERLPNTHDNDSFLQSDYKIEKRGAIIRESTEHKKLFLSEGTPIFAFFYRIWKFAQTWNALFNHRTANDATSTDSESAWQPKADVRS